MRGCQERIPRTKSDLTVIQYLQLQAYALVTRIIVAFLVNTACGAAVKLVIKQDYHSH
jgi:hypothetical protein